MMNSAKIIILSFALLIFNGHSLAGEMGVRTKLSPVNSSKSMAVTADESSLGEICGGNEALKKNEKKFNGCREWQRQSQENDIIVADQLCGGNEAFKKDLVKAEACTKEKSESISKSRLKAETRCGGYDAFLKNAELFRACKAK